MLYMTSIVATTQIAQSQRRVHQPQVPPIASQACQLARLLVNPPMILPIPHRKDPLLHRRLKVQWHRRSKPVMSQRLKAPRRHPSLPVMSPVYCQRFKAPCHLLSLPVMSQAYSQAVCRRNSRMLPHLLRANRLHKAGNPVTHHRPILPRHQASSQVWRQQ